MPSRFLFAVRAVVAVVLLQTLFFKFTGAKESVAIFTKMGMEPWGRIGSGIAEAIAAVLLLLPRPHFVVAGAGLALSVIVGAIGSHLFVLGIEVEGDGGLLFLLALLVFAGSAITLWAHRRELIDLLQLLRDRRSSAGIAKTKPSASSGSEA